MFSCAMVAWGQYSPGQSFSASRAQSSSQATATPGAIQYRPQPASQPAPSQPYNLGTPAPKPRATPRPVVKKTAKPEATPRQVAKKTPTPTIAERDAQPHVTPEPKTQKEAPLGATSRPGAKYLTDWPTGQKLIALTYDDGPDANFTPRLLDYLAEVKVPATFYLCGNRINSSPESVARMVAEGHEVANHTWDHPVLSKLSAEKAREQLTSTHEKIQEAAPGARITTMRPPFGAGVSTAQLQGICADLGYKIVLWDIDTEDWRKRSAASMINNILKNAKDGSIVLMHDRKHGGTDSVMETTKAVIPALRERGFTFVTVEDMLSRPHRSLAGGSAAATTATATVQTPAAENAAAADADQP